MAVFQLGGKNIQVDPYKTSWPASIFYKRQGVQIQVNPDSHWWCLWLCSSTDDVDQIGCSIVLHSSLVQDTESKGSCANCGDLTVEGPATWGFSAPWPYGSVDYRGTVEIDGNTYAFEGSLVYS
jgi:hypothetical protein